MSKLLSIFFLLSGTVLCAQHNWTWGGPIDDLQKGLEILHYDLALSIEPEEKTIKGSATVSYQSDRTDTLRLQLIDEYIVDSIVLGGSSVPYHHQDDQLDILLNGREDSAVTVYYHGETPIALNPPWTGGFTWVKDEADRHWMGLSCQGEGAKIFMPCFDHPSSEPLRGVDLHFTVPKPFFVAANGRLINTDSTANSYSYHWRSEYPVNNYCINFTMGVFQTLERNFQSVSGAQVPMQVIVLDYHMDEGQELMGILETCTHTQEKYFGAYPFPEDKIAVVETPYLGMEHQTINAYGNQFRFTKVGDTPFDWLLHHELGHEWWGNKITVDDWADYWIHEGICSYGDWLFYLEHGGDDAYFNHVIRQSRAIANMRPVVSPANTNSDDAYHPDVYTKGAYIMHGLRFLLGDSTFFNLLKDIQKHEPFLYREKTNTKEFIDYIERYSDTPVRDFLEMHLYTTDLYTLKVREEKKGTYQIELVDAPHEIPLEIRTSEGYQVIRLFDEPVTVSSKTPIAIDPHYWYLKEIID